VRKKLLLLRHALHAAAQNHKFYGCTDVGLSEPGHLQAASIISTIEKHRPERCVCSPSGVAICPFPGLHLQQYVLCNIDYASLTTLELFGDEGVLTGLNHQSFNEGASSWDK
jgi:hypothetical protein